MSDPFTFLPFIAALVALATALFLLPHPCRCPQCAPHMQARKAAAEEKRVRDHRKRHGYFNFPWGEGNGCAECDAGHARDQRR